MKAIINMTTAFLLFLMFLFGWSLVTYQESPEKYQWLDVNGEFKTSSYDVTVSYNLDTSLDELNGNSLNDVFSNNNLILNGDFTTPVRVSTLLSNDDYSLTLTSLSNGYVSTGNIFLSDVYYTTIEQRNIDSVNGSRMANIIVHSTGTRVDFISSSYTSTTYTRFSMLNDYSSLTITGVAIARLYHYGNTLDTSVSFRNVYNVNLTLLGIDNLTVDEMDYWYSEYQRLQENQIENYKELGSTVESSWQFLTGYFTTLVEVIDAQVQVILNPFEALAEGLSIITVPIFG